MPIICARSLFIRNFSLFLLLFLLVIDASLILYQDKQHFRQNTFVHPHIISSFPDMKIIGFDYQNPKIFPFTENYSFHFSIDDGVVCGP